MVPTPEHSGDEPLVLPEMDPSQPVTPDELSRLCACARRGPPQDWVGSDKEGIRVHRRSEVAGEQRIVERGYCEFTLDAPAPAVLALIVDPDVRRTWDDVLGPSMELISARGHDFLGFRFEGLYGLVAKSFFVWCRSQAYDHEGRECADPAAAWTLACLWRHADLPWPELPRAAERRDRSLQVGMVLERDPEQPSRRTKAMVFARVKYRDSTGLLQYVVTNVIESVVVVNSQKLLNAASSRVWEKAAGARLCAAVPRPPSPAGAPTRRSWQGPATPRRAEAPRGAAARHTLSTVAAAPFPWQRQPLLPAGAAAPPPAVAAEDVAGAPGMEPRTLSPPGAVTRRSWPGPASPQRGEEPRGAAARHALSALAAAPSQPAQPQPPRAAAAPPPTVAGEGAVTAPGAEPWPRQPCAETLGGPVAGASASAPEDSAAFLSEDLGVGDLEATLPRASADASRFRPSLGLERTAQLHMAAEGVGRLRSLHRGAWRPEPPRAAPLESRLKATVADWRSSEANRANGARASFDEAFRRCMRGEQHAPGGGLQEAALAGPGAVVGGERLAALRGTEGWLGALLEDLRSEQLLPPWLPQPGTGPAPGEATAGQRSEAVQTKALKTPTAWLDPASKVSALEDSAVWRALDEIAPPKLEASSGKAIAAVGGAAGSEGTGTDASRKSLQGARQSTVAKRPSAAEPLTAKEEREDKIAEESKEENAEEAKPEGEEPEAGYLSAFGAAVYSALAGGEEGAAEAASQPQAAEAAPAEHAQEQEPQVEEQVQPAGGEEETGYFTGFGAAMYSAFGGGGEEELEQRTVPEDSGRKSIIKVQEWGAQASGNARARRAERRKQRGGDG